MAAHPLGEEGFVAPASRRQFFRPSQKSRMPARRRRYGCPAEDAASCGAGILPAVF